MAWWIVETQLSVTGSEALRLTVPTYCRLLPKVALCMVPLLEVLSAKEANSLGSGGASLLSIPGT